jgi:hypothetical protein
MRDLICRLLNLLRELLATLAIGLLASALASAMPMAPHAMSWVWNPWWAGYACCCELMRIEDIADLAEPVFDYAALACAPPGTGCPQR